MCFEDVIFVFKEERQRLEEEERKKDESGKGKDDGLSSGKGTKRKKGQFHIKQVRGEREGTVKCPTITRHTS